MLVDGTRLGLLWPVHSVEGKGQCHENIKRHLWEETLKFCELLVDNFSQQGRSQNV